MCNAKENIFDKKNPYVYTFMVISWSWRLHFTHQRKSITQKNLPTISCLRVWLSSCMTIHSMLIYTIPASCKKVFYWNGREPRGLLGSWFEVEGCTVNAEPLACGIWAIFKYMTKVGITMFADDLGPSTAQWVVRATQNVGMALVSLPCSMCLVKRWPSSSRVILGFRAEERGVTAHTVVHSNLIMAQVDPTKGLLCALLPGNHILLWSQLLFPVSGYARLIITRQWPQSRSCTDWTTHSRTA